MNDDRFEKTTEPKPYREGDARFDVTSLDEVKDENGNGIFHMTKKFKWILALSIVLLIAIGARKFSSVDKIILRLKKRPSNKLAVIIFLRDTCFEVGDLVHDDLQQKFFARVC